MAGRRRYEMWEADWEALRAYWGSHCGYCGCEEERLTRDHIVPFSKGGRGTIGNLVLACERCNSRKGADSLMEWLWKRRAGIRADVDHGENRMIRRGNGATSGEAEVAVTG